MHLCKYSICVLVQTGTVYVYYCKQLQQTCAKQLQQTCTRVSTLDV